MSGADFLADLRAWRDEFARSHGYDLGAMAAVLRAMEGTAGRHIVRGEPRRPAVVPPEAAITPLPTLERTPAAGSESSS